MYVYCIAWPWRHSTSAIHRVISISEYLSEWILNLHHLPSKGQNPLHQFPLSKSVSSWRGQKSVVCVVSCSCRFPNSITTSCGLVGRVSNKSARSWQLRGNHVAASRQCRILSTQRMSTDEIPSWASGASLCTRRFNHMAPQTQHIR